jgi:hypothetical protein
LFVYSFAQFLSIIRPPNSYRLFGHPTLIHYSFICYSIRISCFFSRSTNSYRLFVYLWFHSNFLFVYSFAQFLSIIRPPTLIDYSATHSYPLFGHPLLSIIRLFAIPFEFLVSLVFHPIPIDYSFTCGSILISCLFIRSPNSYRLFVHPIPIDYSVTHSYRLLGHTLLSIIRPPTLIHYSFICYSIRISCFFSRSPNSYRLFVYLWFHYNFLFVYSFAQFLSIIRPPNSYRLFGHPIPIDYSATHYYPLFVYLLFHSNFSFFYSFIQF